MTKEQYLEQVRRLLMTRPPYDQAFIAQAIYTMKQSIIVIEEMGSAIRRSKRAKVNGNYRPLDLERNYKILNDYRNGMRGKELAVKYDLSEGRISHIILRMGGRKYARSRVKRLPKRGD